MSTLLIDGLAHLKGKVKISGSKNAALPIIAATILVKGKCVLTNVPDITDIHNLLSILKDMGAKVDFKNNVLKINTNNINGNDPDESLVRKIRASILLVGPLLARNKRVRIPAPGGCYIGNRPLDAHFDAFRDMGAEVIEEEGIYHVNVPKLQGNTITLWEMSVTATENVVMAATLARGKTILRLASCEPHVQDLCHFLNKMGARIKGIGTNKITIEGVDKLNPCNYKIISDEIEAGTYMILAAATNSEITLENIETDKMDYTIFSKFKEVNMNFVLERDSIHMRKSSRIKPIKKLWIAPSPNFPSDLQAPFAVLMTMAEGSSFIHETMYEGRLNYIKELKRMGANASILDPHRAVIIGPTDLYGKKIESLDLRAGATLIIAALIAEGKSEITNSEIIDRGYENIIEKLQGLGAKIRRLN